MADSAKPHPGALDPKEIVKRFKKVFGRAMTLTEERARSIGNNHTRYTILNAAKSGISRVDKQVPVCDKTQKYRFPGGRKMTSVERERVISLCERELQCGPLCWNDLS